MRQQAQFSLEREIRSYRKKILYIKRLHTTVCYKKTVRIVSVIRVSNCVLHMYSFKVKITEIKRLYEIRVGSSRSIFK